MVKCLWSDTRNSSGDIVHIFMSSLRLHSSATRTVYVTLVNKTSRLLHSYREHAGFIFKSTFAVVIFTNTSPYLAIWFKCPDLLLINSSKLWHIPWHSTLNCKFRFYDWIPRFRPRFLHCGNHRALVTERNAQFECWMEGDRQPQRREEFTWTWI